MQHDTETQTSLSYAWFLLLNSTNAWLHLLFWSTSATGHFLPPLSKFAVIYSHFSSGQDMHNPSAKNQNIVLPHTYHLSLCTTNGIMFRVVSLIFPSVTFIKFGWIATIESCNHIEGNPICFLTWRSWTRTCSLSELNRNEIQFRCVSNHVIVTNFYFSITCVKRWSLFCTLGRNKDNWMLSL